MTVRDSTQVKHYMIKMQLNIDIYRCVYLRWLRPVFSVVLLQIDGLLQKRRNSIANTLELCVSYINPSIYV